jgi:hypothetical protein
MKIVPRYSLEHKEYFVDGKFNHAENETVTAGRSVLSAPLALAKSIPFLELAKSDLLLEENVIDSKWTIDPEYMRLESVVIEFPGLPKLIGSNIGLNVDEALFRPTVQHAPHHLFIPNKKIPVVVGLTELAAWSSYDDRTTHAPLLQYAAEQNLHLVFSMDTSGSVNIATGTVRLFPRSFDLVSILDHAGRLLDAPNSAEINKLREYVKDAHPRGYRLDANWLQTNEAQIYQFEMGDPNPIGRGVALLVRGYLLSVPSAGYAAEITEPSASALGTTKLYMEPDRISKPEWHVTIEEGFEMSPGECNIIFHAYGTDWANERDDNNETIKKWKELGRWDCVAPGEYGLWVEAIAQFLLDGEEYYLTNTLPDSIPSSSGHRAPVNG